MKKSNIRQVNCDLGCGKRSCGGNACELVFFIFACHLIVIFMSSYKLTREVLVSAGGKGWNERGVGSARVVTTESSQVSVIFLYT